MKTIKYGLRLKKTGTILGYVIQNNGDADSCGENTYKLTNCSNNQWLVDKEENAEYVRKFNTPWYNAEYDTPVNEYDEEKLEVIEIEIVTNIKKVDVSLPSVKEMMKIKYKKTDPDHYKYMISLIDKGENIDYSYYDVCEYLRKEKGE